VLLPTIQHQQTMTQQQQQQALLVVVSCRKRLLLLTTHRTSRPAGQVTAAQALLQWQQHPQCGTSGCQQHSQHMQWTSQQ
jgi:hypothetical protein